jgi:hypothetical protein
MGGPRSPRPLFTGDIKLDCYVGAMDGTGSLSVRWDFDGKKVLATFQADGRVLIERMSGPEVGDNKTKTEGQLAAHSLAGRVLTFAVRDGVAYAGEGGKPLISLNVDSANLADWMRELPQAACRLAISANQCNVTLPRVVVAQQIGFRSLKEIGMDASPLARGANAEPKLASDECYVVGDYSDHSMDSRFWGPIKRSAFYGVARWIYWPIARWHELQ